MQKAVFNTAVSRVITTYFKKREGSRVDDSVVKRVKKKTLVLEKKPIFFLLLIGHLHDGVMNHDQNPCRFSCHI